MSKKDLGFVYGAPKKRDERSDYFLGRRSNNGALLESGCAWLQD